MTALAPYALKQIMRFDGLKYPPGKTGIQERVACLASVCKTEHHVAAVVDEWLRDQTDYPTPADLRRIAESLKPIFVPSAIAVDCAGCGGSGWAVGYQEYVPFRRNGHCRYHVREPGESDGDFVRRIGHYERHVMPAGRVISECVWECQCAAGMARRKREE
jgi:hypothetical protein